MSIIDEHQRGYIDRKRGVSADPFGSRAYLAGYMERLTEENRNRNQSQNREGKV